MAMAETKPFYNSALWRKQRDYILKRDRYTCTVEGCNNVATEVHHIIELTPQNVHDSNIALNEDNLTSLCSECHKRITYKSKLKKQRVLDDIVFDADGFPVVARECGTDEKFY